MKKVILIAFVTMTNYVFTQNGTQPDSSRVIPGSEVTRTIDVLTNDILNMSKDYELSSVYKSQTSPNVTIAVDNGKVTFKTTELSASNDTFFYIVRDKISTTFDTNHVVVRKSNLAFDLNPGDANKDDICNHIDLLAIGTAFGQNDEEREGLFKTSNWTPVKAYDWPNSNNVTNYKHADANGSGSIDIDDIDVLNMNYNETSTNPSISYSPTGGETIQISGVNSYTSSSGSDTIKLNISLGGTTNTISKAYGIAFSLKINNTNFNNNNFGFMHSNWFNDANNTIQFFKYNTSNNEFDIAMTKTNGNGSESGGEMGIVDVVIDDILGGLANADTLNFEITNAVLIDSHYNLLPVTTSAVKQVVVLKGTSSINTTKKEPFNIYVHNKNININLNKWSNNSKLEVYNILGKMMYHTSTNKSKININAKNWSSGIYLVKYNGITQRIKLN